jgi:hypothetical protein
VGQKPLEQLEGQYQVYWLSKITLESAHCV